jgi:RHS repeat-associated protein
VAGELVAGVVLGVVFATFAKDVGADVYTAIIAGKDKTQVQQKRYRYTGKEKDDRSGLPYYGARYLAPWMARWTSPENQTSYRYDKCPQLDLIHLVHEVYLHLLDEL